MSPAAQTQLRVIQVQEQIRSMAVTCQSWQSCMLFLGGYIISNMENHSHCRDVQEFSTLILLNSAVPSKNVLFLLLFLLTEKSLNILYPNCWRDFRLITRRWGSLQIYWKSLFYTQKEPHVYLSSIFSHQFVDLCILLGCDYCEKICGLGPKRALRLIQKHRTIENVVLHVNRKVLVSSVFQKQM